MSLFVIVVATIGTFFIVSNIFASAVDVDILTPNITNLSQCYNKTDQSDYRGVIDRAQTGGIFYECLDWTDENGELLASKDFLTNPHLLDPALLKNLSSIGIGPHNYCRNPEGDPDGAWCMFGYNVQDWGYCPEVEQYKCSHTENLIPSIGQYILFKILSPRDILGTYEVLMSKDFGPRHISFNYDNIELYTTEPVTACTALTNAIAVKGKVALVSRGECTFAHKSLMVQNAGAIGVIIYDHFSNAQAYISMVLPSFSDILGSDIVIPSMFMLGSDGYKIIRALDANQMNFASIEIPVGIPDDLMNNVPNEAGIGTGSCLVTAVGTNSSQKICGIPSSSDGTCGCDCESYKLGFACRDFLDHCGIEFCGGCPLSCTSHARHGDMRGNGMCDPECNNDRCEFDLGDCCEHTCHSPVANLCGTAGYNCESARSCPLHCSMNGKCTNGKTCSCDAGWTDFDCSKPLCDTFGCDHGICGAPDRCMCDVGWSGQNCSLPVCTSGCLKGNCVAPDKCSCDTGWGGYSCHIPDCDERCVNGMCMLPNVCLCDDNFQGEWCDNLIHNTGGRHAIPVEPIKDVKKHNHLALVIGITAAAIGIVFGAYMARRSNATPTATVVTVQPADFNGGTPGRCLQERRTTTSFRNGRRTIVTEETIFEHIDNDKDTVIAMTDIPKSAEFEEDARVRGGDISMLPGYSEYCQPPVAYVVPSYESHVTVASGSGAPTSTSQLLLHENASPAELNPTENEGDIFGMPPITNPDKERETSIQLNK